MADAQAVQPAATKKPRQGRSPAFPFIPLEKAIERAEALRVAEGGRPKHYSPWSAVARAWGIGEKTGTMKQSVAALGHYGLFEFQGSGEERAARLTESAIQILLDKRPVSPERDELIRQLALKPAIHAELWAKWKDELPSDTTFETYLVKDRGFSENGARDLINEYKATIAFAKLGQPDNMGEMPGSKKDHTNPVRVGDWVQAEINGAHVFKEPKRVRLIQQHEGKDWVFVDGEEPGIPMEQVQVTEKGSGVTPSSGGGAGSQPPRVPLPKGMREAKFPLAEGEVTITFPEGLSSDSVEDLDSYIQVFLKKAKREAKPS